MTRTTSTQWLDWATWATVRALRPRPGSLVTQAELRAFAAECRERAR